MHSLPTSQYPLTERALCSQGGLLVTLLATAPPHEFTLGSPLASAQSES